MDWRVESTAKVLEALKLVYNAAIGGRNAFCAFEVREEGAQIIPYVQCLANAEHREMLCEAVSAISQPPLDSWLTEDRVAILSQLGFQPPAPDDADLPNFYQFLSPDGADGLQRIAALLIEVLQRVYDYAGAPPLNISCSLPGVIF